MMRCPKDNAIFLIYKKLYKYFGKQYWWPAKTRFEVIVGAILTQNTNWSNVEKAIKNLKAAKCVKPKAIREISEKKLAGLIRSSGYFNIKARKLKNFVNFLYKNYKGSLALLEKEPIEILRKKLLSINGIGPETADSIILYAFDKPKFVIDAYTKRVFYRHGFVSKDASYDTVQALFEINLRHNVRMFNEYHALVVRLCKDFCKKNPQCSGCPLKHPFGVKKPSFT